MERRCGEDHRNECGGKDRKNLLGKPQTEIMKIRERKCCGNQRKRLL
jgi:hypothetical protein